LTDTYFIYFRETFHAQDLQTFINSHFTVAIRRSRTSPNSLQVT